MLLPFLLALRGQRSLGWGGGSKKDYFICVPLRVPPSSQKATHGWWERTVKKKKKESARDYYVCVYHASSATQGRAEESVTSLRSGWGGSGSPVCWEPCLLGAWAGRGEGAGPVITYVTVA